MSGNDGNDGGQRNLDGLDNVFENALDGCNVGTELDLGSAVDNGQTKLGSELNVNLLRIVVQRSRRRRG